MSRNQDLDQAETVVLLLKVLGAELEHCELTYFADRVADVAAVAATGIDPQRLEQIRVDAEVVMIQAVTP